MWLSRHGWQGFFTIRLYDKSRYQSTWQSCPDNTVPALVTAFVMIS